MPPFEIPDGWQKGELLNVTHYATFVRFSPHYERDESHLDFTSLETAQNFIGWWYAPTVH